MPIIEFNSTCAGQVDVHPARVTMISTDDYDTVISSGYVTSHQQSLYGLDTLDEVHMCYNYNTNTKTGDLGIFKVSLSNGVIKLSDILITSNVTPPVYNNHVAVFDGTTGVIKDGGVLVTLPVVNNHIAAFDGTSGTIKSASGPVINDGDIQAGEDGTAGALISYPATSAQGSLKLACSGNSGDYDSVVTNESAGQAISYVLPDVGGPSASILSAPTNLTGGNPIVGVGINGTVTSMDGRPLVGITSPYAGGGTSNAFTVVGLTASCHGTATIRTSTNSVSITKAVPGTDTLAITFSADPGASTTVDYNYWTAAQTF